MKKALIYTAISAVAFYLLLVYVWRAFEDADRTLIQDIANSHDSYEQCLVGEYKERCTSNTQDCEENVESLCQAAFDYVD